MLLGALWMLGNPIKFQDPVRKLPTTFLVQAVEAWSLVLGFRKEIGYILSSARRSSKTLAGRAVLPHFFGSLWQMGEYTFIKKAPDTSA